MYEDMKDCCNLRTAACFLAVYITVANSCSMFDQIAGPHFLKTTTKLTNSDTLAVTT